MDNLISREIRKENITVSKICTYEDKEYQSYRRDGQISGRMISIIG